MLSNLFANISHMLEWVSKSFNTKIASLLEVSRPLMFPYFEIKALLACRGLILFLVNKYLYIYHTVRPVTKMLQTNSYNNVNLYSWVSEGGDHGGLEVYKIRT